MKIGYHLEVRFFKTDTGTEPTREWLRSLSKDEKKLIGEDIKTLQYGWPIGMPLVKKLCKGIWEIRTNLENKISRVLFTLLGDQIFLLHGFIKKTEKTPKNDLDLAINRMKQLKRG
jgi:phage-related protein